MNRAQRAVCHATNGALTGAILFLAFAPWSSVAEQPHHADVELVSHR